jgi:hypothetical protein
LLLNRIPRSSVATRGPQAAWQLPELAALRFHDHERFYNQQMDQETDSFVIGSVTEVKVT